MTLEQDFAQIINEWLRNEDRSATWLAKQLGINTSTVTRWLNAEARPRDAAIVGQLADLLGLVQPIVRGHFFKSAGFKYSAPSEQTEAKEHATDPSVVQDSGDRIRTPFTIPSLPPQGVIGRDVIRSQIIDLLQNDGNANSSAPIALCGMGGIGKTTIATMIAHLPEIRAMFPDGMLWTTLGPEPTVRVRLDDWGEALGVTLVSQRNEEACRERLRSVINNRKMLLIIDDVWDIQHGQAFNFGGPDCRMILTTRETPIAYGLATRERTIRVDVLALDDGLALLRKLVPSIVDEDIESSKQLCERLENLPLALTLAGQLLANEAEIPSRMRRILAELIQVREARLQLLQPEKRLGIDSDDPISLQSVLGMSVERLTNLEQQRFATLAVFGAEPFTWQMDAAAHVWRCSIEEAEETMSRLIQRGIITSNGEFYSMHALLADYALKMMENLES